MFFIPHSEFRIPHFTGVPRVAGAKKLLFDLHVHTSRYSACSALPPEQLLAAAHARGLDGLVITEHDHVWAAAELDELLEAAGRPPLLLFAACEIRAALDDQSTGDLLVYGVAAPPESGQFIDDVCRQVHAQGGIVIAPHPFAEGVGIGREAYSARIDALELYNDRYRSPKAWSRAAEARAQLGIAGTAGSDAHALGAVGQCCTEFEAPIATLADLIGAIRNRQCRPQPTPPKLGLFQSILRGLKK